MAKRLRAGDVIPEFRFDTPYHPQQSFYELLEGDKPVFLVFLRNFGHPLTRNYIMEYIKSAGSLRSARLVCVVQTRPQTISKAIPEGAMPYELMCDAEGVLYRFFAVPSEKSRMKCFSLKAMKIINEAKKQGFRLLPAVFRQRAFYLAPVRFFQKPFGLPQKGQLFSPQLFRQPPCRQITPQLPFLPVLHLPCLERMPQQAVAQHVQNLQTEPFAAAGSALLCYRHRLSILLQKIPLSSPAQKFRAHTLRVQIKYFSICPVRA